MPERCALLSYRHGFHAGNAADVLKHFVLTRVLSHLAEKETPIRYLDTHAGAGRYALDHPFAARNREHERGIDRLRNARELPGLLQGFLAHVADATRPWPGPVYPGSALLAVSLLRARDQAWLHELHPADFAILQETMAARPTGGCRVHVRREDGFRALPGLLPPPTGRACVLIDPPYEVKSDYETAPRVLVAALRRMGHGVFLLWYPVVDRARVRRLEQAVRAAAPRRLLNVELRITGDKPGYGMTASGLFVANPPWRLAGELAAVGPALQALLGPGTGAWRVRELAGEA